MLNGLWAGMLLVGIAYGGFAGTMTEISDGVLEAARESVYLCITMTGVMALWTGLMRIAETSGLTAQMTRAVRPLVNWLFPDIPEDHEAKVHITANIIANVLGLGWAATPSGLKAMDALAKLEEERRVKTGYTSGQTAREVEDRHTGQGMPIWSQTVESQTGGSMRGRRGMPGKQGQWNRSVKKAARVAPVAPGTASNEMCDFLILNISSLQLIPVNIIAYRSQYGSVDPTAVIGPAIVATTISTVTGILYCKLRGRRRG